MTTITQFDGYSSSLLDAIENAFVAVWATLCAYGVWQQTVSRAANRASPNASSFGRVE
jgi:hypothetical protein